jgi:hypothetical protein
LNFIIGHGLQLKDSNATKIWETKPAKWNNSTVCQSRTNQTLVLPYYLKMQDDCDLVLYDWCVAGTNQIVWNSKTARKNGKGCFLQLTEWGRLEIRDGKNNSQLIWESSALNEDGRNCFA